MRRIDFERHFASRYRLEADQRDPVDGDRVLRGRLVPFDPTKRPVEIRNGIPRFVSSANYADNFGLQWNTFRGTQLDSHSGLALSAKRLWTNTRWKPEQLAGKTVLEVGSGAGRFTEILLAAGATVASIDYSGAVESNFANNAKRGDVVFAQADLYDLPFADESFDFVLCYGVLQHTPDAALAYKRIFDKLRPGGRISIDHYRKFFLPNVWSTPKYAWRPFVKDMPPENLLRLVRSYLRWWFPVDNLIRNVPYLGRGLLSVVPIPCWNYIGSGLTYAQRKEWAVLDTFDALSAKYDNPLTLKQVEELVGSEKNASTEVFFGGTGIVANIEKATPKHAAMHADAARTTQLTPSSRMSPRISIVIATHNAAATLERCLRSVAQQTVLDRELIVVDGGSVDHTADILQRNSAHIAYWHSRSDKGIYDAWNQALDRARGEYVCFLGADDVFHSSNTLEMIFDAIGGDEYDLVTGRGRLINPAGGRFHEFGNPWNHRKVERRMTICHPGTLHRRDLFERFGKFDTGYRIAADYDFLLRLPANLRALHVDSVTVDIADGGISRGRKWLTLRERYRAQANCSRVGPVRAAFNYLDKLWRIPVAKLLGIPN